MKLKINYLGNAPVYTKTKKYLEILSAMEETGVNIRMTAISKKTKIAVATIFDFFKKFEEDNNIEVVFNISGRDRNEKNKNRQES